MKKLLKNKIYKHKIYIKIIDTSTYLCYEGNFNNCDFRVLMTIKEIYDICLKTFQEKTYNVVLIHKFIKD